MLWHLYTMRRQLYNVMSPKEKQAINEGYNGAFTSIFDANLTTILTAIILYAVGTGPIQGFAVTLALGVAISMFTAITGTRAIVNFLYGGKRLEKLSI